MAGSINPEFDAYAEDYDAALNRGLAASGEDRNYFARGRLRWLARRLDQLGHRPQRIMDFGCGTGSATPFFLEVWPELEQLLGVDVSARSLEVARRQHGRPRVSFQSMDEHPPSGQLDVVYCNGVFHHIPPAQRGSALGYIRSGLRGGGVLAFWENNPWNPGTRYIMSRIPFDRDARTISPPAARRLLRDSGFEIITADHLFFFPRLLRLLRPLEPLLRSLPLGGQYLVLARRPPR
jgi:SAM-dependent methyltransferase